MDTTFGSLRTRVTDELKGFFGGIQAGISFENGQVSGGVSLGERRVMSVGAIALALVVGMLLGAVLFGRK